MQENVYKDPFAAECNQYARKFDDAFNAKDWVTTEHLIAESEELLKLHPNDYLLKPVREDQLKEVLSRAAAALLREEEEVYLCRRGDVTYRIPRKKILYFTSDRRQVTCVTTEKHYTFYGKLDQVEEELKDSFVRIHQRYLVRTQAVQQISGSQDLVGGQTLPISRSCQQAAMIALTRASLEE